MSRTKVLLVGASGETGGSIVNGLLESGNFVRAVPGVGTGGVFGTNIFFFLMIGCHCSCSSLVRPEACDREAAGAGSRNPPR